MADNLSSHIKFSVRLSGLNGKPTSLTLKKDTIALWFLFSGNKAVTKARDLMNAKIKKINKSELYPVYIEPLIQDFVLEQVSLWNGDSGKGLSDFVTKNMLSSIMDKKTHKKYKLIMKSF